MQDRSPYARRASAPSGSGAPAPSDFSRRPPSASARRSPASASRRTPSSSASARRSPSAAVRRTPSGTGRRPPAAARGNPPSGGAPRRPAGPQRPRKRRRFRLRLRPIPLLYWQLCCASASTRSASPRCWAWASRGSSTTSPSAGVSIAGYTYEEAEQLAAELEETWRNEAYTLSYQDARWTFTRARWSTPTPTTRPSCATHGIWDTRATSLSESRPSSTTTTHPYDFALNVTYDEAKLDAFIDEICAALDKDAVDAVVVPDVGGPVVLTQAEVGLKVNRDQLKEQMVAPDRRRRGGYGDPRRGGHAGGQHRRRQLPGHRRILNRNRLPRQRQPAQHPSGAQRLQRHGRDAGAARQLQRGRRSAHTGRGLPRGHRICRRHHHHRLGRRHLSGVDDAVQRAGHRRHAHRRAQSALDDGCSTSTRAATPRWSTAART